MDVLDERLVPVTTPIKSERLMGMNKLEEILNSPDKYNLPSETTDGLRSLLRAFDTNPFFPIDRYDYAEMHLSRMKRLGQIESDLMRSILNDF